ncbi:hypothetical protein AVL50_07075 [Flammeovirga sp. SJP92]|nr:hypothetical protein AVL50_07075 [Flammeovirga sp. SJP92]
MVLLSCKRLVGINLENLEFKEIRFTELPLLVQEEILAEKERDTIGTDRVYNLSPNNCGKIEYKNTSIAGIYNGRRIFKICREKFYHTNSSNKYHKPVILYKGILYIPYSINSSFPLNGYEKYIYRAFDLSEYI